MRILFWHFYTFRLRRGIETLIVSLANALDERGIDVSILAAKPTREPLVVPNPGIRVFSCPTGKYFEHCTIAPQYLYHLLRYRYDNVVAFFADFGESIAWKLLTPFRSIPLTLYLCYPYSGVPHRYHSFLRLGWDRKARNIIADARWIADEAADLFKRRVATVPVGTDPKRFSPNPKTREAIRREWGFKDDDLVLLNVSALERRKGTWRVVEALARLRDRFPKVRFLILGEGEEELPLRRAVKEHGLDGKVIFGGTTSKLDVFYNLADVFVMLPDAEGNSIACHEAMSCGLPVIVSKSGGFEESVPPTAGFLVDPDDSQQLDSALEHMIHHPIERVAMGQAGRQWVCERFSWDMIADSFLKIVEGHP